MVVTLPFGITIGRTAPAVEEERVAPPGPFDPRRGDPEIGATGTISFSGFLGQEEYNEDLQGENAIKVYTRMRSDSMVKAMLRTIVLPLRGAIPKHEPASDDPRDVHIALACDEALLNMEGQRWDDFNRQAFMGTLTYGFSVFESIYTNKESKPNYVLADGERVLAPYKLAPRLQKTIYRWHIDRNGDLLGVQQQVFVSAVAVNTQVPVGDMSRGGNLYPAGGTFRYIDIPADRLFVFVLEQEGSNFLGESLLRSPYKNFFWKEVHLRIQGISAERHGVGVPYAIVKQGITRTEENAIVNALRNLHAHEKGYMIANEAQLADATKIGMAPLGIMDMRSSSLRTTDSAILYHDRQMAVSILADFLTLGSGIGGNANVMHRDKSSLFFNSLLGIKRPFEDAFQKQVVEPFVDLNFGPQKKYPQFGLTNLETKNIQEVGRALALMAQAGIITPTPELEQMLREMFDLPPLQMDADGNPEYPEGTHQPPPDPLQPTDPTRPGARPDKGLPPDNANLGESRLDDASDAEALRKKTAEALAALALRVADEQDDFDEDDFVAEGHSLLEKAYAQAFSIGAGALTASGSRWATSAADGQKKYLEGFAEQAADPSEALSADQISSRSDLYAGGTWAGYQRGTVAAMGSGARIIWHADGDAATCELCADRDGEEYNEGTLPGFPGEGGFGDLCEGAANCRCWLEEIQRDESLSQRGPVLLAEARCWQCVERGRPTGKLLGHNLAVGGEVYCPACRQLVAVR